MCADWLKNFYAEDKYLDYDRAMQGGYSIQQMNKLIQRAAAQRMPCIVPSTRTGKTVFYALAENARSLDELRRILTAALGSADTNADIRSIYHTNDPGNSCFWINLRTEFWPSTFYLCRMDRRDR